MNFFEIKANELLEVVSVTLEQCNIDSTIDAMSYYGRLEKLIHLHHKTNSELLKKYLVGVAGFNKDWLCHSFDNFKHEEQFFASSRIQDDSLDIALKILRESLPTYDVAFQNLLETYSPMEVKTSIRHEGSVASICLKNPNRELGNVKVQGVFEQCGIELDDLEVINEYQDVVVTFLRANFALRFSLKGLSYAI
ncbi:hypothetical protein [Vibrio nigripulchritudo]|uniref:hypothetical protein n=1 Tax=Vibrio nigripulchritudo TaxID=28173 RepID=UPI00190C0412|nr:hypothetical protein [Vibrio nigripulchritudo]